MVGLFELFNRFWVVAQILLQGNEDDWMTSTEMNNFRNPLHKKGENSQVSKWRLGGKEHGFLSNSTKPFPEHSPKSRESRRQSKLE